jgi:hypothetical protein
MFFHLYKRPRGFEREELLVLPKSHLYEAEDDAPVVLLLKFTVNGEQPADLSIEKSTFSCPIEDLDKSKKVQKSIGVISFKAADRVMVFPD